jgi:acetyl esterase/lipase
MFRIIIFLLLLIIKVPVWAQVKISPNGTATSGFSPKILISGLQPGAIARIHSFAIYERWEEAGNGSWVPKSATYHAWADVFADRKGRVAMDSFKVVKGTYMGVDGYGLLWSMRKPTDPVVISAYSNELKIPSPKPGYTVLSLTQSGKVIAESSFRFVEPSKLTVVDVTNNRLNGTYAFPSGKSKLPVIILLHGSEGGGADSARALATRFAGQGYAAFALNYFAWDLKALIGPPNYHVNQPIELIGEVYDWLALRPEVDIKRIGLYGHSKGAEYATVAATYYPWIKAVIGCVPSDVVWEGYGIGDGRNKPNSSLKWPEQRSSWSWQGKPLAYIPLYTFQDRKWFDNTERYSTSRNDRPIEAEAALISIERSRAQFLLLGGELDEVWASGTMAKSLGNRLSNAGHSKQVIVKVYSGAGHQICGDGTYPSHIWADSSTDIRVKDPVAEGAASANAWLKIKSFMKSAL